MQNFMLVAVPKFSEYVVEAVFTSRGRRAKRISYAHVRGFGKSHEDLYEKPKNLSEEKKRKKEIRYCGGNVDLELPIRATVHSRDVTNSEIKEENLNSDNSIVSTAETSDKTAEEGKEVLNSDKTVSAVHNSTECLENENSKVVDDQSAVPEDLQTENSSCSEQDDNVVIHDLNSSEEAIKTEEGMQECSRTASGSVLWKRHKVPQIDNLTCQDCNFITSSRSLLEVHSRRHTGIKPYVCPDCGKAFPQSSGLNVHMKRHRGQRDYPCDYCEYRAYTKVDKLRHMTIHTGERNQVCQYCGKAFAKDSTLREHVRSIHERPFKHVCSECGFATFRANNLRVHIRMRHRGEYNNHVCPVCSARVKQRNAFLEHMRAHTGEKPFRCEQCESSFACLARLTVHRKSVHEPRKFPCSQCHKTFQTKHHLLRHTVIHTKVKPFSCPFCTYLCNTQGNMTKHVKIIHNMPHFSYRKYKADQECEAFSNNQVNPEWVEKGQRVTEQYLKDLSTKLGRNVTLDELRARENERQKRINDEAEQAKIKRMNRIHTPEHSYHSRLGKMASLNSKTEPVKLEGEEIVDPTTLILQVAAQNADSFVDIVNNEDLSATPHIVQVDLLSGICNSSSESETSQVTVAPHLVQMLSGIDSDENPKSNTQVIHIQTSDALEETEVEESGEFETVILSNDGEGNDYVAGRIYELVSGQNLRLCLNAEFIEAGDGNTVQVLQQESSKGDEVYNVGQNSEPPVIELGCSDHLMSDKEGGIEEADTVVVIINTDHSQENAA
ncbi:hypothetical protein Cfor_03455 [Coptotermes formosanus]|uniref:C2H2-type domain-containing protein n=1 Tax=Coptotermes formosanus TaxID=36987 RepID=A0A6L2PLV7_COPFO|nr:hypothetical protein Cfor_03455 [Coptotermes formosanus]